MACHRRAVLLVLASVYIVASYAEGSGDPVKLDLHFNNDLTQKECLSLKASIDIEKQGEDNWVRNATPTGNCRQGEETVEEPYLQIEYGEKTIIIFIKLDYSNQNRPTFEVGQIQFNDGDGESIYVGTFSGLKGVVNGEIECKYPGVINLQRYTVPGKTDDPSIAAEAPVQAQDPSAGGAGRAVRTRAALIARNITQVPEQLQFKFTDFSIAYYDKPIHSGKPIQVDGCRYAPDLTLITAVSGGVAGALVISALAVALRLCPC